ncbi:hypothetical protein M9H77_33616 [Catharanthus roseus]|uniref:Uncharacterized protein n=1 Tax=Catharanthus roseus TaxID=4058 RepID=A0ACB9ZK29_CATRO|nr:hypothetical protein M9H77_33616 [Catharanthus roseus]
MLDLVNVLGIVPNFVTLTVIVLSLMRRAGKNNILKGLGNNTKDYDRLAVILKEYGVPTVVLKVSRIDWLRNAAGLIDPNYWREALRPSPVLDWYFRKMFEAISEANEMAQGGALSLIGHSAGGWLARVYMQEFGLSNISLLLTLGTPHLPAPKGLPGVVDQTRGLLDYVEKNWPKAVYTPELRYVWARLFGSNDDDDAEMAVNTKQANPEIAIVNTSKPPSPTICARFCSPFWKEYHSPVGSDDVTRPWYGSPQVVEQWVQHLLH